MKKRMTRVFGDELSGDTARILPVDRPVNIVLRSGNTFHGMIQHQTGEKIEIKDKRSHLHRFPIREIDLVVFDHASPF